MSNTTKDLLIIVVTTIIITVLVWLPHLLALNNFYNLDFSAGFATIYRNFDGLEYIVIAKSLYQPSLIATIPQQLPAIYYASHFPLYSLFMLPAASLFGFLKSMLFISILFTTFSAIAFYKLIKDFKLTSRPLVLSLIFLMLPARWLVVHSIGSSEPVFIFFIILALYFFLRYEQTRRWVDIYLVGVLGLLAQLTRPPGILLFIALSLYVLWKTYRLQSQTLISRLIHTFIHYHPLILIPLGLLGVFYWFQLVFNDFLAYFHSGDNIHLTFPPFQVFNKNQFWVGDIWLEDIIYIIIIALVGGFFLLRQKLYPLAFFVLTYLAAASLIAHRDISRYLLPVFPFVLIAFEKVLISKEFRIILVIILLAIYLYAQNFILANIAPVADLTIFD